jgi:polysaccharide export outer membrane protein
MARPPYFLMATLLWLLLSSAFGTCNAGPAPAQESSPPDQPGPAMQLGPGDTITIRVFGQPDMDGDLYVADDGTIHLALVGSVHAAGLAPTQLALRIEQALKDGSFLVNPHVSVTLAHSVSQLVSVLGEVSKPGRYPVSSNTTIFDLLADAGGTTPNSADVIFLIRLDASGNQIRSPIDLKGYNNSTSGLPTQKFKGGDSVFVPRANQFYIYGQVQAPSEYRLEPGMTVLQAIARAGGLTTRGSDRRVDIKRVDSNGHAVTFRAKQTDLVQASDVINVKESIF